MLPTNRDLVAAGKTTQQLLDRLLSDHGPRGRSTGTWIVRWQGRIKLIEGIAFFASRQSAEEGVKRWLRTIVRDASCVWQVRSRYGLSGPSPESEPERTLASNWGYKKSFRDFVDKLADYLIEQGVIQFQELDPPAATPNALG